MSHTILFLGLRQVPIITLLAHYYGELNVVHPFREGNGRTIRAFLRQLAAAAEYRLNWSVLSQRENNHACAEKSPHRRS